MKKAPGFTLIELLASICILLILMTVMSQTVGMVSTTWLAGKARIDSFTQARLTLAALDRDVQRMVLRPDLGAFTDSTGSAGTLAFYTRVQGSEGDRSVSLVEYRVQNPSTEPRLVRNDYGMNFSGSTARVLSLGQCTALPDLANSSVRERQVAPNVVRLDWKFIDRDGVESDRFQYDYTNPNDTKNTQIIRISMLVLDTSSYNLLLQSNSLASLLSGTSGNPSPGESKGAYWQRLISSSALPGSLPRPVLKSLRVFERSITIPVNR